MSCVINKERIINDTYGETKNLIGGVSKMKKLSHILFSIIALTFLGFGFTKNVSANETDLKLEIADNKNQDLVIKVSNLNKNDLKNVKGRTVIPKELQSEFSVDKVDWKLPVLKSNDSQEIIVKRIGKVNKNNPNKRNGDRSKKLIPQLGELNQKTIVKLVGLLLIVLLMYLVIKKKKYSLLLLLIGVNLLYGSTVLAVDKKIESLYKIQDGKEIVFKTSVSYDIVDTPKEPTEEPNLDTIRVTGIAIDSNGQKIKNKEINFTSDSGKKTVETDESGYFHLKLNKGEMYQAEIKNLLSSTLVVNDILDYKVTDKQGKLSLGKEIENKEVPGAYVKLSIQSIFIDPEKAILEKDGTLQLSGITDLDVGDVIVVGESEKYPNGILTKISQVMTVNNNLIISGEKAQVEEIFEEIHTPKEGPTFETASINVNEDVNVSEKRVKQSRAVPFAMDISNNSSFTGKASFDWDLLKDKKKVPGLEKMSINGDVGITGAFSLDYAPKENILETEFSISPFAHASFNLEAKAELSEKYKEMLQKEIAEIDIQSTVPFLSFSVPLSFEVSPSMEGKVTFNPSIDIEPKYGFSIKNGSSEIISEHPKDVLSLNTIDLEGEASIEAMFKIAPSLEFGLNGKFIDLSTSLIKVDSGVGPELKTTFKKMRNEAAKANSEANLKGEVIIKPFEAISKVLVGDGLDVSFDPSLNLYKTSELSVSSENASINEDKITVSKGATVPLQILDNQGNRLTPKLSSFSSNEFATIDKDTLELKVKETAKNGDTFDISFTNFDIPGWFTAYKKMTVTVGDLSAGKLEGVISEALNNQPIKDAKLTFFNEKGNKIDETITNEKGQYTLSLPIGKYTAEVVASGYIPEKKYNIIINKNEIKYNAKLKLVGLDYSDVGQVLGKVTNATNNKGIPSAKLIFRRGSDNTEGQIIAEKETNANGSYDVNLPGGNYTMSMEKNGYLTGHVDVIAIGKQKSINQNGSITPNFAENEKVRIVLTWKENPRDLDSHLTGETANKDNRFHIYYRNKQYKDAENSVNLDVDDTTSFGPETVTVLNKLNEGTYTYAVHKYSGSSTLGASEAAVAVYMDNQLVQTYAVPGGEGNLWKVFEIRNGLIVPINQMSNTTNRAPGTSELLPQ